MANDLVSPYARRLSVGLTSSTKQEIYPAQAVPYGMIMMVNPALQPRLAMGLEKSDGQLAWIAAYGIIINGKRYSLEGDEGILAKYKYNEVIPLIRTAPEDIYITTGCALWPIVARKASLLS